MITRWTNTIRGNSHLKYFLIVFWHSTCVICLEEFTAQSTVREIPICNHIFHAKCIEEWLDRDEVIDTLKFNEANWTNHVSLQRCPDCRHDITVAEFERLKKLSQNKKDAQTDQKPNNTTHVTLEIHSHSDLYQETHHPLESHHHLEDDAHPLAVPVRT